MKVSSISFNTYKSNSRKIHSDVKFGSIFSNLSPKTQSDYNHFFRNNPQAYELRQSATRIFRELSCELAIAKILNPKQKSQIKILGCSDGSEAWSYAIAMKEAMGKDAKNVSIQAVDISPSMIEIAKTGLLVLSDSERELAQNEVDKSPIAGNGWDKYLKKTNRPDKMDNIINLYPHLTYLENDPVVNKKIGAGLDWYNVNKDGLPSVTFECGDMFNYLKPDEKAENVVYVMANTIAYVLKNRPDDFMKLFKTIKEENKGKNVYIVTGSLEDTIFNTQNHPSIDQDLKLEGMLSISRNGFRNLSDYQLKNLGIKDAENTAGKIYTLKLIN